MPGDKGGKTKHDRCVEGVEQNSPEVDNPHAVCVSAGVRPSSWKKIAKSEEVLKIDSRGQWKIEKKEKEGEVEIPKKEFIDEHKKLVNVLRSPSHKDDKKEADKQEKELKEYSNG